LPLAAGELRHRSLREAGKLQQREHFFHAPGDGALVPAAHLEPIAMFPRRSYAATALGLEHHRRSALFPAASV
jgi:hypothetical protein